MRIDTSEKGVHEVGESLKSVGAITMFVEDRARAKAFYEQVFDVSTLNEDDVSIAFKFENLIVNLLETHAAPELIEPAPVATADNGARFQLTIWVDDTDAVCAELGSRGVELLNGPVNRDWGVRTAAFADPDGHIWEVAGKIPPD
jgi:catechol 2,3-dioxygenase-like lactoylglutathione lyase family enzyme